jgi:hypothetical protein
MSLPEFSVAGCRTSGELHIETSIGSRTNDAVLCRIGEHDRYSTSGIIGGIERGGRAIPHTPV